jgi:flagellar operon protein
MNVRQLAHRVDPGQQAHLRDQAAPGVPASGDARNPFASHLEQAQLEQIGPKISSHAWQRMQQRGITMTDEQHRTLAEAMQHLAGKGARDALVLRADAAFVVNVPNRTVVTAIDRDEMQQRVFTQIDSAMLV